MSFRHAYLHGFASSAQSTKGQAMRRFYAERNLDLMTLDLNRPRFGRQTYTTMLSVLDDMDAEHGPREPRPWRLFGSSMGGYTAARWAELNPERVDRLILLCPAFDFAERWPTMLGEAAFARWKAEGTLDMPGPTGALEPVHFELFADAASNHPNRPAVPCPTLIIHGRNDPIVPIEGSREYAAAHADRVRLIEVDDDHSLASSLEAIQAAAIEHFIDPHHALWWDYFGGDAEGTAEHFRVHLDDFLSREGIEGCETGVEVLEVGRRAAAYCRCPESLVAVIGRALRPHRVD